MACQLSDVVGIMDMDGFLINKRFYCEELRILKIEDAATRSLFFEIGVRWGDLTAKDSRTCEYVMHYIHKLPFGVPQDIEATEISALEGIICDFYHAVKRNESSVIG